MRLFSAKDHRIEKKGTEEVKNTLHCTHTHRQTKKAFNSTCFWSRWRGRARRLREGRGGGRSSCCCWGRWGGGRGARARRAGDSVGQGWPWRVVICTTDITWWLIREQKLCHLWPVPPPVQYIASTFPNIGKFMMRDTGIGCLHFYAVTSWECD